MTETNPPKIGVRQRHLLSPQIKSPETVWQAIRLVRPLGRRASPPSPSWHHGYRDGASMTNGTILFVGRRLSALGAADAAARCPQPQNQLSRLRSCPQTPSTPGQSSRYARRHVRLLRIRSGYGHKNDMNSGEDRCPVSSDFGPRDLIFAYKLVFGLIDMNVEDFFILRFTTAKARRAHRYKLFYPLVKLMQGISVLAIGSFVCGTVSQTVLILTHLVLLRDRLLLVKY